MGIITSTIVCPNCGANATNHQNCEYCGSLLVRFVDAGVNISDTHYGDNTYVFPGLLEHLRQNLDAQKAGAGQPQEKSWVSTDIYVPDESSTGFIASVTNTKFAVSKQGFHFFPDNKLGLGVIFNFASYLGDSPACVEFNDIVKSQLEKFRNLKCFPLFKSSAGTYIDSEGDKRSTYEYAIDFGEDVEGAARLLSDIMINVFGHNLNTPVIFETNVGNKAIRKSREDIVNRYCGEAEGDSADILSVIKKYWWAILGIAILILSML